MIRKRNHDIKDAPIGHIDEVLKFWFGRVEKTILPSENTARVWFRESLEVDQEISRRFSPDLGHLIKGNYNGIKHQKDQKLSFIEQVLLFSVLLYSENLRYQETSVHGYN